jgi:hypothetical protein
MTVASKTSLAVPTSATASLAVAVLIAACTVAPVRSTGATAGPTNTPVAIATIGASSPSTPAFPAATPGPSAPTTANGWRSAHDQPVIRQTQLLDVAWSGERFVATGWGWFYDSADGETWQHQEAIAGEYPPEALAVGGDGLVAVGGRDSWHSADGLRWTSARAAFPRRLHDTDEVRVEDVIATATGWLAVGRDEPQCQTSCGNDPLRGLIWTSDDGLHWDRVTGQPALAPGGINAIAAFDGGFVAAGNAAGRAAFWTSPDGHAWSRVPDDPAFARPSGSASYAVVSATGVAAANGVVVAVGNAFEAGPAGEPVVLAWRSTDGRTWKRSVVEADVGGQAFSVAETGDRFLMTGPSGETSCLGGIWSSEDGLAWGCEAKAELFAGFGPYAAAASSTVEVAVGLTSAGYDEEGGEGLPGAVFWRPLP